MLFGIFIATSCEEPVDLDIAIQAPQIVVNSNFTPGQPFQVSVSKSKNILTAEAEEYVNDAVVRVFSNGVALEELELRHLRHPIYQSKTVVPESGKVYRLEVAVPEQELIIAEDIVPFPVTLDAIEIDTIEVFGEAEEMVYKVAITVNFSDPTGAQDYYHLSMFNQVTSEEAGNVPMNGFDGDGDFENSRLIPLVPLESDKDNPAIIFHYEDGGVLFTDEEFDGQSSSLKFYSLLRLGEKNQHGQVVGLLRTVSKAYYLYHCLLYTSPSPRDRTRSRMPSSA